jgi:DNA topoisomerase I
MTNLVIVESPAKCSKIQGFLGLGWRVIASLGHIRHLKEDLSSVGLTNDFEANWEFMKEKAKAIASIKEAAAHASKIYLAADDDREGELIAYSVALLLKLPVETTPRAVFHEITQSAVLNAVNHPRTLDMQKVSAAQARAILDMMVGFTISPLLWKHVAPSLSAGRCQTPALRLVCEREEEIGSFKATSSWKVSGNWTLTTKKMTPFEAYLTDELEDEESALAYLEIHHNKPTGTILSADTRPWTENPPVPLITSTLQQFASSQLRSAPKETMRIAQRLYEAGHITYMRTDKAILSEEAKSAAKEVITSTYGAEYVLQETEGNTKKKATKTTKKTKKDEAAAPQAQEAHEAIRPTHMELEELPQTEDWSAKDRKVYQLIRTRALQSCMAAVKGLQRTIQFVADGDDEDDFQWRATWRKTTFDGWRKAGYSKNTLDDEAASESDAEEEAWSAAEQLTSGMLLRWTSLSAHPHETKAPQRYTEATLVRELEQRGIGRPSTFAALISTIQDKTYVETKTFPSREVKVHTHTLEDVYQWPPEQEDQIRKVGGEKDRLTPTSLGKSVLDFCLKHFDDLFAYPFTAQMEGRLDQIAEGNEPWKQVLRDTWGSYKDRYETLSKAKGTVNEGARRREFGNGLVAVQTKKGPLLLREAPTENDKPQFYGWPPKAVFETITKEEAEAFVETEGHVREGIVLGEHEGHEIIRKSGKYGLYVEWNGKKASCTDTDTLEKIIEKLEAGAANVLRVVGDFEIRTGPYGPYMFKRSVTGPSRKFVSVPKEVTIEEVNEAQLIAIFQNELQKKARSGAYSASRGGGAAGGGNGSWRGGRGGRGGPAGSGGQRGRGRGRGRGM